MLTTTVDRGKIAHCFSPIRAGIIRLNGLDNYTTPDGDYVMQDVQHTHSEESSIATTSTTSSTISSNIDKA